MERGRSLLWASRGVQFPLDASALFQATTPRVPSATSGSVRFQGHQFVDGRIKLDPSPRLTVAEAYVLRMRGHIGAIMTLEDVALLSVSRQAVQQLEAGALGKLARAPGLAEAWTALGELEA